MMIMERIFGVNLSNLSFQNSFFAYSDLANTREPDSSVSCCCCFISLLVVSVEGSMDISKMRIVFLKIYYSALAIMKHRIAQIRERTKFGLKR